MNGASSEHKRSRDKATELEMRIQQLNLELTQTKEALQSEIVERNRAQEQLVKSEEKFRTFLESVSEGIVAIDATGRVVNLATTVRNSARDIIENFMIAANVAMAQFLERRGVMSLRRVVRSTRHASNGLMRWTSHAAPWSGMSRVTLPTGSAGLRRR